MNPLALNFDEDCYYYSGDIFPSDSERIDECLFDNNSCYFDYFECCGDLSAINYQEDCNFYNNEIGVKPFDYSEVHIENCNFINNNMGIKLMDESNVNISNSNFINNTTYGLAIEFLHDFVGNIEVG